MKIRTRLFIRVSVSAFALILAFMFLFLKGVVDDETARYNAKISLNAGMFPVMFTDALYNIDNRSLNSLANAIVQDPEMAFLEIRDEYGEVRLIQSRPGGGNLTESKLKILLDDYYLGTITIRYTDALIQAKFRQSLLYNILLLVAMLAVLGLMVFWTAFSITRPLYQIIDYVRQLSAGQDEAALPVGISGELQILLDTIRSMRTELRVREEAIIKGKEEAFAHQLELTLGKQQLDLEIAARQKSEALRAELQATLDNLQKTQEQLIMAEKMASLGSLVAGIAHEINTPIGNSVTSASFLNDTSRELQAAIQSGVVKRSQLEDYLQTLVEASDLILFNLQRAADLVRSFKQVSVDQTSDAERTFNLKEYFESVIQSLVHVYKKTPFRIQIECPSDLCVTSFPGAFSQIITNFIMNSLLHGFRGRTEGTMHIEAKPLGGNSLEFVYRDDGVGMDEETLAHHFEPFYTTMRNAGGTGLGAYIVFNLVTQRLKGTIRVESVPGQGVAYTMIVPIDITSQDTCA